MGKLSKEMHMAAEHQRQLRQAIACSGTTAPFSLVLNQRRGFATPSPKKPVSSKKVKADSLDEEPVIEQQPEKK